MSQSAKRKALRKMYKVLKARAKVAKSKTPAITIPKAPLVDTISTFRTPKVKRALSRVIEFESRRPGEFGHWLDDLHIEHFRAGFQDRLEAARAKENEREREDSEKQATAENRASGSS